MSTSPRAKRLVLLAYKRKGDRATSSAWGLQRCLLRAGMGSIVPHKSWLVRKAGYLFSKAGLLGNLYQNKKIACVAQVHRLSEMILFPTGYFFESIPYSYDCWPYRYDEWEDFFRRHRVRTALLSSRDAVAEFQRRLPRMKTFWVPEGCEVGEHQPEKPLARRSIDVLELGRRYASYHVAIRQGLEQVAFTHLYEKSPGSSVFQTQEDLAAGYGDTKISICFPAGITDPQWAGNVETATLRYFEAMASKCLIVGHAPAELVDLYGFNPVIEADLTNPVAQLHELLKNIAGYQDYVDRAFRRTLEVGTLESRARMIVDILLKNGYRL